MKGKTLNFLSLILVFAAATAGTFAQINTERGIEKKTSEFLSFIPAARTLPKTEKIKSELIPALAANSSGAKLSKADAARASGPASNPKAGSPIEDIFELKLTEWASTSPPGELAPVLFVTSGTGTNARPNCRDVVTIVMTQALLWLFLHQASQADGCRSSDDCSKLSDARACQVDRYFGQTRNYKLTNHRA